MRGSYFILLLILVSNVVFGQVTLPSYQGVQYKGISGLATLTTTAVTSITATDASSGGDVTLQGASSVTAKGVCWSTSSLPTLGSGNYTSDGTGTGSFTSSITGLNCGTTYYVRAYATNSSGTSYGDETSFTTSAITLGATYQGGKVAYILGSGDPGYDANVQHGLIVTASNISDGLKWNNGSDVTTSTSTGFGDGQNNTTAIIDIQGAGSYAAQLCADLDQNGYTDWYLPSKDELNKINANRASSGTGMTAYYWSSSEASSSTAWRQNFAGTATGSGTQAAVTKSFTVNRVRAVRSF